MAESADIKHDGATEAKLTRMELWISWTLRVGVSVSLVLIVLGTLISFVNHRQYVSSPSDLARLTSPGAAFPCTMADVVQGLRELRGQAIVATGLLLLIITPVMRVAISVLAFAEERDYPYVVLTAIVLTILLLSFLLGRVES